MTGAVNDPCHGCRRGGTCRHDNSTAAAAKGSKAERETAEGRCGYGSQRELVPHGSDLAHFVTRRDQPCREVSPPTPIVPPISS